MIDATVRNKSLTNRLSLICLALSIFLLAGCGGGSSNGTQTTSSSGSAPSITPTSLQFSAVANGPTPASQSLLVSSYSGDELTVSSPSGSLPRWISVTNNSTGSVPFMVNVNITSTGLSPGTYTTTLRFNDMQTFPTSQLLGYQDVSVTYTVTNTLSVDKNALTFNDINNNSSPSASQTINIYGTLGWTALVNNSWLNVSSTSGTAPGSINVNIAALGTSLSPGTYNGSIVLTSSDGQTKTINVTLNVNQQRLFVANKTAALTSLPSRSKLTTSMPISVNGGDTVQWTATAGSTATWLTINSVSGTTGTNNLSLTANPTGLADGLYRTSVDVTSPGAPANTQTIQVALYVHSTDATNQAIAYPSQITAGSATLADPLRPYVYTTTGGPDLSIYNVYTGALVKTITVNSGQLTDMAINSAGTTLYAANMADKTITVVDLDTQSVAKTFNKGYFADCGCSTIANDGPRLIYAEPNGYPVLITGSLEIIDANTGTVLDTITNQASSSFSRLLAFSPGKDLLFFAANNSVTHDFNRYKLSYSYLSGGGIYYSYSTTAEYVISDLLVQFDLTADGTHLCVAIDRSAQLTCLSTTDLSDTLDLPLGSYSNGIAIDSLGNIYASYVTGIDHYNASGVLQPDTYTPAQGVDNRQLTVSGDGLRLIARGTATNPVLYIFDTSL